MTVGEIVAKLREKLALIEKYEHALSIVNFDFETVCPGRAKEDESEVINLLDGELFALLSSEEMKSLILELYRRRDELDDPLDRTLAEHLYEDLRKIINVSPELDRRSSEIFSGAYIAWERAKQAADYSLFRESLEKAVGVQKELIATRSDRSPDDYDEMLGDCEPGMLQADLDPFFERLKSGLIDLLGSIKKSRKVIREDFLRRPVPIWRQEAFSRYLLETIGYDLSRGAVATTEHPFTLGIARQDVRVTTHYHEDDVFSNMYSIIHEGGHAIFMQNEPAEDHDHYINDRVTNGMHESVSRFFENVVGRSRAFIHLIYPEFQKLFPEIADVSERELYEGVNVVRPSLIRTEADEVTYCLHIIIRYEMEKLICSGKADFDKLNSLWADLYEEYLGIRPGNDREGILQDVHWSSGLGYFPSYAMGNCYNAMYLERMKAEFDLDGAIGQGDFAKINGWLSENVFGKANRLSPKEWILGVAGRPISPDAFLSYLRNKYSEIYGF
ncbi:MAG: carboxypeptidase M32 [Clostridia bacterium]|nr:carboxypeptidase M32 [Clostridia bacterium]